jgi:hypothetical protein
MLLDSASPQKTTLVPRITVTAMIVGQLVSLGVSIWAPSTTVTDCHVSESYANDVCADVKVGKAVE